MSNVEIFTTQNDEVCLEVTLEKKTVWLSQAQMVNLFGRERSVITKHINNVFKDGELEEISNVQNLHIAKSDKPVKFFRFSTKNLDTPEINKLNRLHVWLMVMGCFKSWFNKSSLVHVA